jgi:hypothetical protein
MKLIAQIAAGILLAWLIIHAIEGVEAHLAMKRFDAALPRSAAPSDHSAGQTPQAQRPPPLEPAPVTPTIESAPPEPPPPSLPPDNFVRKATPADAAAKPVR